MIRIFVVVFALMAVHPMIAQTPEIDSLVGLTNSDIPQKDKVDIYNRLAFKFLVFDSVSTAKYGSEAIKIASEIGYTEGESDAYYAIGWVTKVFGHHTKAIELFNKVLEVSRRSDYVKGLANGYNGLGDVNRAIGNYTESLDQFLKSLDYRIQLGDTARIASSYNNIGIIYFVQKDYEKALEYYINGLELREKIGDPRQIAVSLNNVGIVYVETRQFYKGLEYYEKCLAINQRIGARSDVAKNYHNIGVVYDQLGDHSKALNYSQEALNIYKELGDNASQTYPLLGVATSLYLMDRYKEAKTYALEGIEKSRRASLLSNMESGYSLLSKIENKLGNNRLAFDALSMNKKLSDSLKNIEQTKRLTLLEAEYKFNKEKDAIELANEKEKLVLSEALKRERIIRSAAFGGTIILLLALFILYRYYKLKKEANTTLAEKNQRLKELRESEKKLAADAIASKERELATMAMASHEKNSILKNIEEKIGEIEGNMDSEHKQKLKVMKRTISDGYSLDKSWDSFIHRFEDVHPQFFDNLKTNNPSLTTEDLKLSAYLKIGMTNKEIANVTHLTLGSVKSKINRLKKKMEMSPDDSVRDFMLQFV